MKDRSRVILVDADPAVGAACAGPCAEAGFVFAGAYDTVSALLASDAAGEVIVLDAAAATDGPSAAVRSLLTRWPNARIIVTGGSQSAVSHAIASGARGFLPKPYAPADLIGLLRESLESSRLLDKVAHARGAVVAVYSPKGGAGCSTIAVAIAVLTAARPQTTVALVDLDLQFGDVDVMLDVRSPNSIADLIGHDLDRASVDDTFVRHASGVRVLPARADLGSVASIRPEGVVHALEQLRDHFDVIVCDLWSSVDDLTTRVLRTADCVVLVTKPELPALRSMNRLLAARDVVALDDRTLIVANRLPVRGGLSLPEVEHSLGRSVSVAIPSDSASVIDAINRGIPIVDPRVRSRVRPACGELARKVWDSLELGSPGEPTLAPARR